METPGKEISAILKHDRKINSYKFALLRAINDVALSFPDIEFSQKDVAIPLRMLAEYWIAYYWPFVDANSPIYQGTRSNRAGGLSQDMVFRRELTALRLEWEQMLGSPSNPSDGFLLMSEMRVARKRAIFPASLLEAYRKTILAVSKALEMPIRYAGPEGSQWSVFKQPVTFEQVSVLAAPVPGTRPEDKCLLIPSDLWQTLRAMSLWVEALCIHEWSLFIEGVTQGNGQAAADRGAVYRLLTDQPDNRRPLTWERNNIDLILLENKEFICPWTEKRIHLGVAYDLDHLIPVSVYPINELWNLVPSDPYFNSHIKRARLPSPERLARAEPHLAQAYTQYQLSRDLKQAIRQDVAVRFSSIRGNDSGFPAAVAKAAVGFLAQVAESRNLATFE